MRPHDRPLRLARNPVPAGRRRSTMRERLRRVRLDATFAVQSGLAAAAAWLFAQKVVGHEQPFFAPIAAVIVLSTSGELRWRRAVQLAGGVALGIAIADGLIFLFGVGVIQVFVVVTLAILIAVFVGGGSLVVAQAASSAVLVVTLAREGDLNLDRFVDALVGGVVGLLVMSLVVPHNPLTRVRRAAGAALTQLAEAVSLTADALRNGDATMARRALADLRASEASHTDLADSLTIGREAAALAPLQWRHRPALQRYLTAAVHIERATRNARVLARRSAAVIADAEPVPQRLPEALDTLALAVRTLRDELAAGQEPVTARQRAVDAVRAAGQAYLAGLGFSGSATVAQVRGSAVDLLRATGLPESRADRLVEAASPTTTRAGG